MGDLAKSIQSFRKTQQIYLIAARSIQADDSVEPVAANGAFIQSPQREADDSLYSDYSELVMVFPNVKARTATESIVVLEEQAARIPGEFSAVLHFDASQAQARVRHVVELAGGVAPRLTIAQVGSGTPEVKREKIPGGKVRLTWERRMTAGRQWEWRRAPSDQVGPVVWLTTLPDWNAFGHWYRELLKGREELGRPLADQVGQWAKTATNRADMISVLLARVAQQIRYTGLEFGRADFQPQRPADVFRNQYGDCKDKANLLRVMLRQVGITSYLAFVNTDHAGRIERRCPDYRQFDHVFLAIPQRDGGYLYCDPTIRSATPGMLRPDDSDREVLIVKENESVFVRTPAQEAGTLRYNFDLKLQTNGGLVGWFALEADGYYGAAYADFYASADNNLIRRRALSTIQEFYRAADLIDVDSAFATNTAPFRLRAYFIVPADGREHGGKDILGFPRGENVIPDFGGTKKRETSLWQWQGFTHIQSRIQLPTGWTPLEVPRPFQADCAAASVEARWESQGSNVTARLLYHTKQAVVSLDQYIPQYNAVVAAQSWLSKPIMVTASDTSAVAAASMDLTDFPVMPSGEGQLELVERRFPLDGNLARRREALLRVREWFPEDKHTRFVADIRLIDIELQYDPKNVNAIGRARELVRSAQFEQDIVSASWASYKLGLWLDRAGEADEALTILKGLAEDNTVPEFRRAWATVEAVRLMQDKNPDEALSLSRQNITLDSNALPSQFQLFARLLLRQGKSDELRQRIEARGTGDSQETVQILGALIDTVNDEQRAGRDAVAAALLQTLDEVVQSKSDFTVVQPRLKAARQTLGATAALQRIVDAIRNYIAQQKPEWWDTNAVDPALKTHEQFAQAIEKLHEKGPRAGYLRHSIESLIRFPPDPDSFPERLWRITSALEDGGDDEALLSAFLGFCDQLSETNDWFYEGKFVHARHLVRKERYDDARILYNAIAGGASVSTSLKMAAYRLSGDTFERQKNYTGALAMYRKLESDLDANYRSYNGLLHATFINLAQNNRDEAFRLIGLLAAADQKTIDQLESPQQVRDLVAPGRSREATEVFWARQQSWLPQWEKIEVALGLPPAGDEIIVPIISDLQGFGKQLGYSIRSQDKLTAGKLFRSAVQAARWQPRLVAEAAGCVYLVMRLVPDARTDFHKLAIAMLAGLKLDDPELNRQARVQLAAQYIDSGQTRDSLDVVHAYFRENVRDDNWGRAMTRIWGLAALREPSERESATKALEAVVASSQATEQRGMSVDILAQLYRGQGRAGDELSLLKRELENPVVRADEAEFPVLNARYQELGKDGDMSARFSLAVTDWLQRHRPAWFDFAEPRSLDDARVKDKDLDALLKEPPADYLPAERVKIGLLVAESSTQPYYRKVNALDLAIAEMAGMATWNDEVRDMYTSLHGNDGFDQTLRLRWLWFDIADAVEHEQDFSRLATNALTLAFTEVQKHFLEIADRFAHVDKSSPPTLEKFLLQETGRPLDSMTLAVFNDAYRRILQFGDFAAAQRLYERAGSFAFADNVTVTRNSMQLSLLKQLNRARKTFPRDNALRGLVLVHWPETEIHAPATLAHLHTKSRFDQLDKQTVLQCRLDMIRNRDPDISGLLFWTEFVGDLDNSAMKTDLGMAFFRAMLDKAGDDDDRSQVVPWMGTLVDTDDIRQREQALALLHPYRDPEKCPTTYASIRFQEISLAMRDGRPVNIEAEFRNLKHPYVAEVATREKLKHYLQTRNIPALRRTLEQLSADQLLDFRVIALILPSLELVGMTDEAQLVRNATQRELYRSTLRAWCALQAHDILRVFRLARVLRAADPFPPSWLEYCQHEIKNERLSHRQRLEAAQLGNDWPVALTAANELIAERPTLYSLYWDRAEALHHLGRDQEAIEPLRLFVQYCKDELEYPQAMRLLEELKGNQNPTKQ